MGVQVKITRIGGKNYSHVKAKNKNEFPNPYSLTKRGPLYHKAT